MYMYAYINVCSFFFNIYIRAYVQYVCAFMYVCICMYAMFMQTFRDKVCVLYIPIRAGNLMSGLRQECVHHFPKVFCNHCPIGGYLHIRSQQE